MTSRQWEHLRRIQNEFAARLGEKYVRGAGEHQDDLQDLTELQILEEAIGEAVDQVVYLLTLREKLSGFDPSLRCARHTIGLPQHTIEVMEHGKDLDR